MTSPLLRHLVLAAVTSAAGLAACEGCRSTGNTTPTTAPVAEGAPPTIRLYLVTDLAGALEPCGCTKDQLGGLDHFGAWVKHEQARVPAALVASAGPLFYMDDKLEGDRADQDRIKAQTIAHVLHGLGFAAFAPGANDWNDGREGLDRLAQASGGAAVRGEGGAIVREVGGIRVGFVGYGQSKEKDANDIEGTVRRGVDEAKKQGAEVLVALAAVGRGEAKRIADAVPELTAVVVGSARSAGDSNTTAPQGEQVGDVLVVQGSNHLQSVAVLDLYVREPVVPGHVIRFADATGLELSQKREELARRIDELHTKIASWERDPKVAPGDVAARKQELTSLEAQRDGLDTKPPPARGSFFRYSLKEMRDSLGRDPGVESDMLGFYKAVNDHNRTAFADRVPQPAPAGQAGYVGIEVCSSCHPGPREVWNATPHARAYATLTSQFKEFNLECVSCHVTGYERPGGSTVTHVDKLKDVECEVCHGPGSRHVQSPTDRTRIVAVPDGATCLGCHHPPHVEGFDPAVKMKEILGPGHGMPR
ncbi:MAG TPA: multiheme c-type cytochrome [Polyangiaceae bacterium]|jgi:hypothetical protein